MILPPLCKLVKRALAGRPGFRTMDVLRGFLFYSADLAALHDVGEEFRDAMYRAAKSTHHAIYRWSKYSSRMASEDELHWTVFYTIVDTYYIPWHLAPRYAQRCDLMAKHWVFGECAIATAIRSIYPVYETLDIQFYWSSLSASDCHRMKWHVLSDGFHRCRHDHLFSTMIYESDATREKLLSNKTFLREALSINGLIPVPTVNWGDIPFR
jgi:hypothetical protein